MKIDHLGIATKGIDDALAFWQDALGLENVHTEIVEEQPVLAAYKRRCEARPAFQNALDGQMSAFKEA